MTEKKTIPCEPPRTRTFSEEIEAQLIGMNLQASRALRLELENRELRRRLSDREQELQEVIDEKEGVHV